MVETIDLTLSDNEEDNSNDAARTLTPGYSTLPIRLRHTRETQSRKRLRSESPTPRVHCRVKQETPIYTQNWRPPYLHGVVKHVRVVGHRRHDDIELSKVLNVDTLDGALLSSFAWDIDWLFNDIGLRNVNATFITDEKDRRSCALQLERLPYKITATHVWHCPPTRGQRAAVHSKLMLLFRKDDIMRIVIPTGNLQRADWGAFPTRGLLGDNASHSLDNLVFMLDLPRHQEVDSARRAKDFPFQQELIKYLNAMEVPSEIQKRVAEYDFSKSAQFRFVWTGYGYST
jgi:hypothetical protein